MVRLWTSIGTPPPNLPPAGMGSGLLTLFLETMQMDYEKQLRVLAALNFIIFLLLANLVLNMGILVQVALMRSGK
jgi:hypothetical protein